MAEPGLGGKNIEFARLPAIAACRLALCEAARLATHGAEFEPAAQVLLIVLHLRQQMISRLDHAFEGFFWQCSASSVKRQSFNPKASINSGAVGISLLFSATITCASTIRSAWRSADIMCAALRSLKRRRLKTCKVLSGNCFRLYVSLFCLDIFSYGIEGLVPAANVQLDFLLSISIPRLLMKSNIPLWNAVPPNWLIRSSPTRPVLPF